MSTHQKNARWYSAGKTTRYMKHYKLSEDLAATMKAAIEQMAPITIKESNEGGTFEVVVSTEDQDRQGEVVRQNGWMLDRYKANPVVLWAHNYSELPVGVCDTIEVQGTKTVAKGRFADHPFAQHVRKLYDAGFLRTTSVGFIPLEMEDNVITRAELLEFSFVPVPANPFALSLRDVEAMKLDIGTLMAKGIVNAIVKDEEGEPAVANVPDAPETPAEEEPVDVPVEEPDTLQEVKAEIAALRKELEDMKATEDETNTDEGETLAGEAEVKNLNTFIAERAALKAVAGAVSDALARMNARAREHYQEISK